MNNKKLTNTEIIKALDEAELFLQNRVKDGQPIRLNYYDVGILRNISQTCAKAYDEIDQLQTENENLKVENQSLRSAANSLKMHYEEAQAKIERLNKVYQANQQLINALNKSYFLAKTEAYKEFAERLKEKSEIVHLFSVHTGDHYMVDIDDIDNLVKEMVGENNG